MEYVGVNVLFFGRMSTCDCLIRYVLKECWPYVSIKLCLLPHSTSRQCAAAIYLPGEIYDDEFDFECLGNLRGPPYLLRTNIYSSNATGGREQRIYLSIDPIDDSHFCPSIGAQHFPSNLYPYPNHNHQQRLMPIHTHPCPPIA